MPSFSKNPATIAGYTITNSIVFRMNLPLSQPSLLRSWSSDHLLTI